MSGIGKCIICRRDNVKVDLYNGVYQCGFCRRNSGGESTMDYTRPVPAYGIDDIVRQFDNSDKPLKIWGATGSRQLKLANKPERKRVWDIILATLREDMNGYNVVVLSGGSEGMDEAFAYAAMHLELPLIMAIPNYGYGHYYWGQNSVTGKNRIQEFNRFIHYAKENGAIYYSMEDLYGLVGELYLRVDGRKIHSNLVRNIWMVQIADEFLVYDPTSKGTAHCLKEIKKQNRPRHIIYAEV